MIRAALADKQRLVADILHVPHSELDSASELLSETDGEKEARLLVMTAIAQGLFLAIQYKLYIFNLILMFFFLNTASQLTAVLNESLRISEEEAIAAVSADPMPATSPSSPRSGRRINRMPGAPTSKLLAITSTLNKDLTQLLVGPLITFLYFENLKNNKFCFFLNVKIGYRHESRRRARPVASRITENARPIS